MTTDKRLARYEDLFALPDKLPSRALCRLIG